MVAEFYNGCVGEYGAIPIIVNLLPKFHEDRLITLIIIELLALLAENGASCPPFPSSSSSFVPPDYCGVRPTPNHYPVKSHLGPF